METYVITDPKREVIYGVLPGQLSEHDALCEVISDPRGTLFDGDRGAREIEAVLAEELADGKFREVAPAEPTPNGDHNEHQVTEALCRRFAMARDDGLWSVVTYTWFVTDDSDDDCMTEDAKIGKVMEREEEYMIVEDLRDLGGTEQWADYRYPLEDGFPLTEDGVREAAQAFDVGYIEWDGEEFR